MKLPRWTKLIRWTIIAVLVPALFTVVLVARAVLRTRGRTLIEFDIDQNKDLTLLSAFSEPPQFAIWLEEPVSHWSQTIFVTHRAATGDWIDKTECPVALWFEVHQQQMNDTGLPSPDTLAPIAVTGATPQEGYFKRRLRRTFDRMTGLGATPQDGHFRIRAEVEPGSRWICWIEVNFAGDINYKHQGVNVEEKIVDWYLSGQPALIYHGEITAVAGKQIVPEIYGQSVPNSPAGETVQPVSDDAAAVRDIFKAIEVRVIRPRPRLFK